MNRRRLEVRPDGRLWDPSVMASFLNDMDRRNPRPRPMERLSKTDPFCMAVEAESRGRAA